MPIETSLVNGVSVFTVSGVLDADQVIDAMSAWYPAHPTLFAIYDVRSASMSGLRADDFLRLAASGAQYAEIRGKEPRTAIVVKPKSGDALVAGAFEANGERVSPIQHKIVFTLDEAYECFAESGAFVNRS